MTFDEIRSYCIGLPGAEESFPFGNDTLVFTVGKKMFALINIEALSFINVKCDPDLAVELRELYAEITPGYHMNKKHWNSISLLGQLTTPFIQECIYNSYQLIFQSLPKKLKDSIPS